MNLPPQARDFEKTDEPVGAQNAFDMYGRIKEGVHVAGYSFERACNHLEWLLDENRWRLAGRFSNVNDFLDSIKLDQFRIVTDQRKRIAQRIKELQPEATQRAIAKVIGVDAATVNRDLKPVVAIATPPAVETVETKGPDGHAVAIATPPKPTPVADLGGAAAAKLVEKTATKKEKQAERREERLDKLAEISKGNADLSTAVRYPIIYADPPWRYENPPMGATSRSIENHYPTMTLEEICSLPVGDLATDDALLYLWATAPKLAECMRVIEAWGFEYRTNLVWDKEVIGMGYHARNQHEILLIAKRGEIPPPEAGKQPSSVLRERRAEHSAKPIFYYQMIEAAYPQLPKIELFCRSPRDGWAVWGNQAEAADAA